jgi:hypothetical protein
MPTEIESSKENDLECFAKTGVNLVVMWTVVGLIQAADGILADHRANLIISRVTADGCLITGWPLAPPVRSG